jgi:hypothetical protein
LKSILEVSLDLQFGEAGLRSYLAVGHDLGETQYDANTMDGFEAGAFSEEVVERKLGEGSFGHTSVFVCPTLFEIPRTPIVGSAALGNYKEPGGELIGDAASASKESRCVPTLGPRR